MLRQQAVETPLPSDCRYREDVKYLREDNVELAAEWKHKIEEKQRREAKLRKAFAAKMGFEPRED